MSPRSVFTEMSLVSWYKTLVVSHVDNAIYAKLFYDPDFTLFTGPAHTNINKPLIAKIRHFLSLCFLLTVVGNTVDV